MKSFSQFKNDFANVDTFYVSLNDAGMPTKSTVAANSTGDNSARQDASARRRSLSGDDDKKSGR